MKIVLFGPPGAGKGTQAAEISKVYGLPHISTGELLRRNIEARTQIGLVALGFIERGKLAPDDVVMEVLHIELAKCEHGFLLDGFPRTLPQAEMLDKITDIDVVLNIDVDSEKVVDRITNRLVCSACGKNYNKKLHPETVCSCGAHLKTRADDTEEIVRERLKVYEAQTMPIIDHYKAKGKLVDIDGDGSIDEVFASIKKVLDDYGKKR